MLQLVYIYQLSRTAAADATSDNLFLAKYNVIRFVLCLIEGNNHS